ncbi:MAG: glucokinase, partial [Nanoarchaeota archaeon]
KKDTKLKNIKLVNDFYANAASLPFIKKSDVFVLNKGSKTNKNKMIIGPGTGLGKAYSLNSRVYPSEGGLTIIGIEDIEDYALIDYFKKKIRDIVYYEDILSGRGLSNIYEYLEINSNLLPDSKIRKIIIDKKNKPELITENYKKDKLSEMTIDIFVKFYARYTRDSALNILCSEVYLAGGISNSLKEPMKKDFMKEFAMHRHYKNLLKKIGVSVITNSDIGLIGAGAIAAGLQQ